MEYYYTYEYMKANFPCRVSDCFLIIKTELQKISQFPVKEIINTHPDAKFINIVNIVGYQTDSQMSSTGNTYYEYTYCYRFFDTNHENCLYSSLSKKWKITALNTSIDRYNRHSSIIHISDEFGIVKKWDNSIFQDTFRIWFDGSQEKFLTEILNLMSKLDEFQNWSDVDKYLKGKRLIEPKQNNEKEENSNNDSLPLELNNLIGLASIKEEVKKLIGVVTTTQIKKKMNLPVSPQTLHMVFQGNPGTGKTTVARILGSIFKEIGLLSKGHLIETDRAGIVGKFIGHTEEKILELVESAKGGILFIDEAYALAKNDNDFGKVAIDTLVKSMEDYRDDLIVIVAGYPNEMNDFISSNPGLKSRFAYNFNFEDYTINELTDVFKKMCNKYNYQFDDFFINKVQTFIVNEKNKEEKTFGNARGIRNIFEKIEKNQHLRISKITDVDTIKEQILTLIQEDVY
jgi:stage V sporulation protein K